MVKVKKETEELLQKILYGIFLLFLAYLIYEILRTLLGGSLGFEELVIGLLIANLGYSLYLRGQIGKIDSRIYGHIGWHKGKNNK